MIASTGINEVQLSRWATVPSETEETKCQNALAPMISTDEEFDLDEVLKYFNKLFGKKQAE